VLLVYRLLWFVLDGVSYHAVCITVHTLVLTSVCMFNVLKMMTVDSTILPSSQILIHVHLSFPKKP